MGIYDREYYRGESGDFPGPSVAGRVCKWLIIVNVVVYLAQMATQNNAEFSLSRTLDLNPARIMHWELWRLVSYAFLHSDAWQHIVFNMFALWFFGRAIEDLLGSREFLGYYLVSALVGGAAFAGVELLRGQAHSAIGASGAVTAVMVLFALNYPRHPVHLFGIIAVPAYALVICFVAMDAIGVVGNLQSGVAFAVHLGGAAFAFLYHARGWRVLNWWPSRMSMRPRRRSRPRLRVYHEQSEEETGLSESAFEHEEMLEVQVDEVLKKVARFGKASLSERENQILLRASEVYKQRRK